MCHEDVSCVQGILEGIRCSALHSEESALLVRDGHRSRHARARVHTCTLSKVPSSQGWAQNYTRACTRVCVPHTHTNINISDNSKFCL